MTDGTLRCWGSNRVGQIGDGTFVDRPIPTAIGGTRHFIALALDNGGACALTSPGVPYCWGSSGVTVSSAALHTTPTAVPGIQNVTAMSASNTHVCAVGTGNAASCWGSNLASVLGDGTTIARGTPNPVSGGLSFTSITTAALHSCAVSVFGVAYCWGINSSGALGNGSTVGATTTTPSPVSGGLTFASVSVGGTATGGGFTCGLTTTNAAFCWGGNTTGSLGDGSLTFRTAPTPVSTGLTFAQLRVGGTTACAITATGAAFCWGTNSSGQVGNGTTSTAQPTPVPVVGGLSFMAIAVGSNHACGVTTAGAAYCWGNNGVAQLGNGTGVALSATPVAVTGGHVFSSIAAGSLHTCALASTGVAYCWGNNATGERGDGTFGNNSSTPVAVAGGRVFAGLTGGLGVTCGWTPAGAAFCWGDNLSGQGGDGTFGYSTVPTLIQIGG